MNQQQSQERPIYDRLPFFSILAGILGFLACCNPPLQLICGSAALILAWLSKKEQPLKPQAIVGIILGCIYISKDERDFGQSLIKVSVIVFVVCAIIAGIAAGCAISEANRIMSSLQ